MGHEVLGETREKMLAVLGALLVATSHIRNHLLCRTLD